LTCATRSGSHWRQNVSHRVCVITRKTAIHENMSHGAGLLYRCHALPGKRARIDGSGLDARPPEFFIYLDNSG
jgi:hypothetical protein